MAANYPSSLPVKDTAGLYLDSNPHASLHDNQYDEIAAIAAELGTNPKGTSATVRDRITSLNPRWYLTYPDASCQVVQNTTVTLSTTSTTVRYKTTNGSLVKVWFDGYAVSGSGTAGYVITLKMPHTFVSGTVHGWGRFVDASTTGDYICYFVEAGSNTIKALTNATGSGSGLGETPSVALASGDKFEGFVYYEI